MRINKVSISAVRSVNGGFILGRFFNFDYYSSFKADHDYISA